MLLYIIISKRSTMDMLLFLYLVSQGTNTNSGMFVLE